MLFDVILTLSRRGNQTLTLTWRWNLVDCHIRFANILLNFNAKIFTLFTLEWHRLSFWKFTTMDVYKLITIALGNTSFTLSFFNVKSSNLSNSASIASSNFYWPLSRQLYLLNFVSFLNLSVFEYLLVVFLTTSVTLLSVAPIAQIFIRYN